MESTIDRIICPECKAMQEATIEHTVLFDTYIHQCKACSYIIMESEWHSVYPDTTDQMV